MKSTKLGAAFAAALSLAVAAGGPALAGHHLDEAMRARLVELGYELDAFADLGEDQVAQIRALLEADHEDDALRAAIDEILAADGADDGDADGDDAADEEGEG